MKPIAVLRLIALALLLLTDHAYAASFDCTKASTKVEKIICADALSSKLDEALADNYKYMSASDIGDGARSKLKASQRLWITKRNACADTACVVSAYASRMDEICDYPVLSGIHPSCSSADDVKEAMQPSTKAQGPASQPAPVAQKPIAKQQPRTGGGQAVEDAANKNATKIAALGFSKAQLQSMIYTRNDLVNPLQKLMTLEGLLGVLFENQNISKITRIEAGKNQGILLKVSGAQSSGILFNFDGGDAFISHTVTGEKATRIEDAQDEYSASISLRLLTSL